MKLYEVEEAVIPEELKPTLARMVTLKEKFLPINKLAKGQYEMYCPYCQNYKKITYKELKEIRENKKCPICETGFTRTSPSLKNKKYLDYVEIMLDGKNVGLAVYSEWTWGEPIKCLNVDQFAVFKGNRDVLVKCGYGLGGMGSCLVFNESYFKDNLYRKAYSDRYTWFCYDYYNKWLWKYGSRYDKKKMMEDVYHIRKSSQQTVVQKSALGSSLIKAISLFDINKEEDLTKHMDYLLKNQTHLSDFKEEKLNVYYLDYLDRNNINLGEYFEYSQNLKKLGFKLDKPTDFKNRLKRIEDMVCKETDAEINKLISERYNKLPTYSFDNIKILPFERAQEIRRCGKTLHNCIGGYVERYSKGETDLYHMDIDDAITVALEIKNNKLLQAYVDNNRICPPFLMEHIKSFCKTNGFSLGRYA